MPNASLGNLRNNLSIKKENPNDKFYNLWDISKQLEAIHKLNLVHGNFYNENLLCATHDSIVISDFRLCRLANQPNINNDIYELLPHFAPEVLNDKLYTKAADIYSFGILMWEMTSGVPAFHICKGDRPEIIEGTIPEYIELMKRCWDNDPEKRPTANELINIFYKWSKKYPIERNDEKRIPASVRTESYGLPDTKMTLAESEGHSFPYATRIFKETSSSLHKPNFQKDKLGRGKKDRL
ncbi:kinase-like domain-containing protein [Rhizophagus irregularis DAOM 181602=DAOM 197198]|uniref:Kinase-like domain-containing protein n=1 Tax=Rhizophagus irregularis (strain DAOM 181602 / DAOM 197198 / MUCL 43194) TaxID=747089 RepID=A0A2P4PHU9_RHIID|nr:kinase-like domain-containing protein [Rhizophagus irregularis DAOM 181602=DAOM 197198]POG64962.1 kinase-like domain-containing protein [Rhizophagus irregularis DAOM 181602=DAOM 197198]|eukprot:XP_025171828.1 kinase-like domain-containing protein [Rhizophagus irregularis DAOM 181602=DAOM 197198]